MKFAMHSISLPIHRRRARGFTFLEVLFAIMVLGIGFILVAAMFPAAIQQTRLTVDDSTASGVWLGMHRKMVEMARTPLTPPLVSPAKYVLDETLPGSGSLTAPLIVYSFNDSRIPVARRKVLSQWLGSNVLVHQDLRYACVPFFRRGFDETVLTKGADEVQMFFVAARSRVNSTFGLLDIDHADTNMAQLDPTRFSVTLNATQPPTMTLKSAYDLDRSLNNQPTPLTDSSTNTPAGAGAYVIISNDGTPTGFKNGQIYRLGAKVSPSDTNFYQPNALQYFVAPDAQGASDAGTASYTADAFIVGRYPTGAGSFDGPVQDLVVAVAPVKIPVTRATP
jgi:prepilin-type N-terminal cleavage/methylation domain-containing protein